MGVRRNKYAYPCPFTKDELPSRPLPPFFNEHHSVGMISAEAPFTEPSVKGGHEVLGRYMDSMGLHYVPTVGHYQGKPERSYIVLNPSMEQMKDLGQKFGQESVIHSEKGKHKLVYTNGPDIGKYTPGLPSHEFFENPPNTDYTMIPGAGFLRLHFDWETKHAFDPNDALARVPAPSGPVQEHAPGDADSRAGAEHPHDDGAPIKKSLHDGYHHPHPNAYDWHDGHTDHHRYPLGKSAVAQPLPPLEHPHTGGPPQENPHIQPVNDQAAGVGVKTYADFAKPYGTVNPGTKTNLLHYGYHGKLPAIEKLVADNGFRTYFAGGKYGKPDLANKNYNTGHLMVYDPTPASGGDFGDESYTNGWRQIHELSHALTYPHLNSVYGEGRRIGKLGVHRTTREALRAVHWEWLAAHKQRELSAQIGVHVPDDVFHRELNTVMHDAAHRAVTGKFTQPSDEGYVPFAHKVPLETALGMVRDHAAKLGLSDHNSLATRKHEGDDNVKINSDELAKKLRDNPQAREELAKALREQVVAYTDKLTEMRQRELRKADAAAAQHEQFAMSVGGACPGCGNPDAPGSCTCLLKSDGTGLFAGAEQGGKKTPDLFSGAKKGAAVLGKKTELFNGADQSGKKSPELFSGAKKGAAVLGKKTELFNGADQGGKKCPGLFSGAKKGAAVLGKQELCKDCGKHHGEESASASPVGKDETSPGKAGGEASPPFETSASASPGKTAGFGKQENLGGESSVSASPTKKQENLGGSSAPHKHGAAIKKSESPLFRALAKAEQGRKLCDGCGEHHAGARCKSGVKVVKADEKMHADDGERSAIREVNSFSENKGTTPSDITPKKSPKNGSGGEITKGKALGKADVPMAKPPSGATPGKGPAPMSKPSAGGAAMPKAPPGAVKPPQMAKPAGGAPAPAMKAEAGAELGSDPRLNQLAVSKPSSSNRLSSIEPSKKAESNPALGEKPRLNSIAVSSDGKEKDRLGSIQPKGKITNGPPALRDTAVTSPTSSDRLGSISPSGVDTGKARLGSVAPTGIDSTTNRLKSVQKADFGMGDGGKVATTPAAAAGSANIQASAGVAPKQSAASIRGRPSGHIGAGAGAPAPHPVVKLPGAHLFGGAPSAARPPAPAPSMPGKQ
jgi:hypothetical protein